MVRRDHPLSPHRVTHLASPVCGWWRGKHGRQAGRRTPKDLEAACSHSPPLMFSPLLRSRIEYTQGEARVVLHSYAYYLRPLQTASRFASAAEMAARSPDRLASFTAPYAFWNREA